ncbi:hypothetical protein ORV05_02750 [Amycolatopsis cynarae]|uniref:Uncharacterized protein n=1 Tax=Amycolatopsis cynarae TaxID=2995223 RepID=A0ABY7B792_9PSEU|nr:hypothetical protein [Amycolatopsis sp. HUAS 11-8]WAL66751.1 hypothetical protein ORV05_02750 [Amycolatopsis sp. HUAS 11-8]
MSEPITDEHVVKALRPFVRAARPVLEAMRTPGRLEELAGMRVPGSAAWAAMGPSERADWWINRVGRLTALVTAIPGLGGALADRLPVQDAVGAAAQGLLLCAIAGEHGVDDVGDRVRLIAWVLFERRIDPALARGEGIADPPGDSEEAQTAKLTGEDFSEAGKSDRKITLKACAGALWRMGRALRGIGDELEKRPRGRFYHRAFGMLPVVGMAGDYLAERSALKRVAQRADSFLQDIRTQSDA